MRVRMFKAFLWLIPFLCLSSQPAEARRYHHHHHHHQHYQRVASSNSCFFICTPTTQASGPTANSHSRRSLELATYEPSRGGHLGGRPRAWCGWWMRMDTGIHDVSLNLARNWARVGSNAGGPRVGAIVVWAHHVGRITGRTADGQWIVKSGNDGHAVRERPRSLAGAIAFRNV